VPYTTYASLVAPRVLICSKTSLSVCLTLPRHHVCTFKKCLFATVRLQRIISCHQSRCGRGVRARNVVMHQGLLKAAAAYAHPGEAPPRPACMHVRMYHGMYAFVHICIMFTMCIHILMHVHMHACRQSLCWQAASSRAMVIVEAFSCVCASYHVAVKSCTYILMLGHTCSHCSERHTHTHTHTHTNTHTHTPLARGCMSPDTPQSHRVRDP
jgi:hypothetical protein